MDERKIVLACPGAGGARDKLVACLLVFDMLHAAKGRANVPPEQRPPFRLFLDEIQTYDGAAGGNLAAMLEEIAKYEVKATLLNQNPERLTKQTLNALTTNRSHLITTALDAHAASLIAREWGADPPPSAITGLPRWRFIAQVTHKGALTSPFMFSGESIEDAYATSYQPEKVMDIQPVIDATSGRTNAAETITQLDTLDDRIREHLETKQGRKQGSNTNPDRPWSAPAPTVSQP